jgi:nucleotide-binding universal stress UspA family protein
MSTSVSTQALSHQSWEYERPAPGGIVVPVDGSKQSIAALNTAASIARRRHCALHVVTVLPPFPSYHINPGADDSRENVNQLRVSLKDSELSEIMKGIEPEEGWTHEVVVGRVARVVAAIAEARAAELVVMGRRRHGAMDRVLGGETTLQVMRLSTVPVLGVDADLDETRIAVVATDFSPGSIEAAKTAVSLLGTTGTLYLTYVEPPVELLPHGFSLPAETRFPGDVVVWFRRLTSELATHPGILVEPIVLNGRPVPAVLEFADRVGADLIAAGSHGHTRMERFLLGSVSTGLVRNATCAVMVVPPRN